MPQGLKLTIEEPWKIPRTGRRARVLSKSDGGENGQLVH